MRTIFVPPEFPLNRRMRKAVRRGKLRVVREGGERLSLGGEMKREKRSEPVRIGRRGELLVQSRLLPHGIDSAPMTVDKGVDLIAFRMGSDNKVTESLSIQVKATAKLWDGRCYSWGMPQKSPADIIAFVAVDKIPERIWLFKYADLRKEVRGDWFDLYPESNRALWTVGKCESHLLENIVDELFPPFRARE